MPTPLDATTITVVSPDGNITAEIGNDYRARLGFRAGSLVRYDEPTLERQLGQLARLAWVGYLREQRAIRERDGRVANTWDPKRRRYREALGRVEASGMSTGQWVQAWTTGLEQWTFAIASGAVRNLTEANLVGEVESAVASVIAEYKVQVVLLKDEFFGFDLPPAIRHQLDEITYE
jgi:hypothetical protein